MADKKTLVNIDFGGSSSIKGLPSVTAASGDYIVITDASDDGKAKKGPSFATNDGKFLRHDGTWVIPAGIVTSVDSVAPTSGNVALSAVRYVSQSLTDAQKTQARANIGAGTSNLTLGNTASTAAAGNHNHDGTYLPLSGGGTISANATPIVTFKKSASSSGSFIGFKPNNQDNSVWLTGVTSALAYRFSYSTNGGTTVTKKMELDTDGNLEVAGSISEAGTALSSKYLGISSTAADSTKLNGQAASYYLNYSNLSNKPTIPAAQVNSDWNASSGVAKILNKPTLATVATSGSYNDLSNKPTIPSVSNATITVKQTGRNDQTFTLNGSATTINLDNTTYSEATASASGLMSSADKAKVDSLGTAAYVNTGSSSGNVPLLDSSGKLPTGILPALAVTDTFTAASQAAMLALSAQKGDICIRTDENKTYVLSAEPASTLANWKQLLTPTDANSYHSTGSWSGLTYTAANNGGAPNLAFTIPTGTSASTVCVGNDSRLSDARPASDVSAWAKAATKPSYEFSEISNRYQSLLGWGGPTLTGTVSPLDVATIDDLGHNKFAFMSAASVVIQYSRDGGSSWTDYGASDNDKRRLVTLTTSLSIGKRTGSSNTTSDKLRVILNSDNAGGNVYTSLRRLLFYISTNGSGGCTVKIEYRTIGNYRNNVDTWGDGGTHSLSGWSGWNSPNFACTFGGGNDQTSQIAQIRLTFGVTSVSSTGNFQLVAIRAIGFPLWSSPSTMAATGHLYSFDIGQNAAFPAKVSATTFTENGTDLSNKYLGKTATAADSSKLNNQAASYYLNYNNLTNKPTIPAAQVNSDWNASSGVAQILNKPTLATVATSGSYNDLSNKPTIPSVSNATITVKQTGRNDQTFTLNGSATTINLDNTTYSAATTSADGLMSSTDKTKLDGIATGATKVIESTVSGWGFTKNAGTVTSVDSVSPTNGDVSLSAVRYVSQSLTAAQKTQARSNIGAGTSNLTLGNTASTAAAGNHDHDGQYLSTQGGELMSGNVPILTLYNKNTPNGSTFLDFKYNGQDAKQWRAGVEGSDDYFYILYTPNGSSGFLKKVWATPTGEWWTDSDIYEAGTKLSAKYYAASNPNGYTSNTGTVIGSGLTANNIILGNGGVNIKASSYTVATSSTTWSDSDDTKLPTMKAISNKIASSGGTTKYTHHITASWSNGSGANYRGGTISFQFEDTTSSSYSQNNVSSNTLVSFILTHCGISVSSGEKSYPVNATLQYRDDSSKDCYIASKITNSYSSIYIVGYVVTSNSFYYESGGSYLWNYLPDGVSVIKIEDIVH